MTTGLHAPLGPQEEIALRRIAHGSQAIDAAIAAKLIALALVARTRSDLCLTALGRLRYDALPKAPLLARRRSIHAVSGSVENLIEKARQCAQAAPGPASKMPREKDGGPRNQPFRERACRSIERVRRKMEEHRETLASLCASSQRRIVRSRALLENSVPIRPGRR
jgi:hypothetical protein